MIAAYAEQLAQYVRLPGATSPRTLELVADKLQLARLCAAAGVAHREHEVPDSDEAALAAVTRLGLPVIAKWARPWLLPPRPAYPPGVRPLRSTEVVTTARRPGELCRRRREAGSARLRPASALRRRRRVHGPSRQPKPHRPDVLGRSPRPPARPGRCRLRGRDRRVPGREGGTCGRSLWCRARRSVYRRSRRRVVSPFRRAPSETRICVLLATPASSIDSSCWSRASAGVHQPSVSVRSRAC